MVILMFLIPALVERPHPHRFQKLLSSGLSIFAESSESDTLGFDLTSFFTVTAAQVAVSNDGQATSTCTNAEDLAPAFTPEEETRFVIRYVSLAATFTESDSYGVGLINSLTLI